MQIELTAVFQQVPQGYIGFIAEARLNLEEAARLVLEANRALSEESLQGKQVIREPLRISAA